MSRPFIAIVPQTIRDGDKVLLKGLAKNDAYEYSINFVSGTSPTPSDVAYHYKTIVAENIIVENSKKNGEWNDEIVKEWPSSDGPGFALEFAFTDGTIYVYMVEGENGRNLVTFYEYDFELSDIHSVQVWGDVEKVQEITFRYS